MWYKYCSTVDFITVASSEYVELSTEYSYAYCEKYGFFNAIRYRL